MISNSIENPPFDEISNKKFLKIPYSKEKKRKEKKKDDVQRIAKVFPFHFDEDITIKESIETTRIIKTGGDNKKIPVHWFRTGVRRQSYDVL